MIKHHAQWNGKDELPLTAPDLSIPSLIVLTIFSVIVLDQQRTRKRADNYNNVILLSMLQSDYVELRILFWYIQKIF